MLGRRRSAYRIKETRTFQSGLSAASVVERLPFNRYHHESARQIIEAEDPKRALRRLHKSLDHPLSFKNVPEGTFFLDLEGHKAQKRDGLFWTIPQNPDAHSVASAVHTLAYKSYPCLPLHWTPEQVKAYRKHFMRVREKAQRRGQIPRFAIRQDWNESEDPKRALRRLQLRRPAFYAYIPVPRSEKVAVWVDHDGYPSKVPVPFSRGQKAERLGRRSWENVRWTCDPATNGDKVIEAEDPKKAMRLLRSAPYYAYIFTPRGDVSWVSHTGYESTAPVRFTRTQMKERCRSPYWGHVRWTRDPKKAYWADSVGESNDSAKKAEEGEAPASACGWEGDSDLNASVNILKRFRLPENMDPVQKSV